MKFSEEQRKSVSEQSKGKTIESLEWEIDGEYWVMTFTDGSETSLRFMAELV